MTPPPEHTDSALPEVPYASLVEAYAIDESGGSHAYGMKPCPCHIARSIDTGIASEEDTHANIQPVSECFLFFANDSHAPRS